MPLEIFSPRERVPTEDDILSFWRMISASGQTRWDYEDNQEFYCKSEEEVIQFFRAVHDAVKNKNFDDFNELAALQIANTIKVIDMLIEDIIRDGTVLKREKHDAKDNIIIEYVTHPSLLALPKLVADLGLNPAEFMITPRAIARDKNERDVGKTLAEMMSRAGRGLKKKDHEEDD